MLTLENQQLEGMMQKDEVARFNDNLINRGIPFVQAGNEAGTTMKKPVFLYYYELPVSYLSNLGK